MQVEYRAFRRSAYSSSEAILASIKLRPGQCLSRYRTGYLLSSYYKRTTPSIYTKKGLALLRERINLNGEESSTTLRSSVLTRRTRALGQTTRWEKNRSIGEISCYIATCRVLWLYLSFSESIPATNKLGAAPGKACSRNVRRQVPILFVSGD